MKECFEIIFHIGNFTSYQTRMNRKYYSHMCCPTEFAAEYKWQNPAL